MFVVQNQFIISWLKAFLLASAVGLGAVGLGECQSAKEVKIKVYPRSQVAFPDPMRDPDSAITACRAGERYGRR